MATTIQDGTGTKRRVKVTELNRLSTDSITEERAVFNSIEQGNTFLIVTDFLSFTGTTGQDNGVLYIKNNSNKKMLIHNIKFWSGTASQLTKISTYRNPTLGTLISSEIDATVQNINFGSANTYEGLAYQGDGSYLTLTNGDVWGRHYLGIGNQQMLAFMWNGAVALEKDNSLGITCQPPNGS